MICVGVMILMSVCSVFLSDHPIAKGIPEYFDLGTEECYGERFDIPQPDEVIFEGWFDIGEVFRGGCVWNRGYGKVFYFQPGHETNNAFQNQICQDRS